MGLKKSKYQNSDQNRPTPERGGDFWVPMVILITVALCIGLVLLFLQVLMPQFQIL